MKSGIKKVAMWLVLLIIFIMIISAISGNMYKKMTYSELLKNIKEEKVETIQIEEDNKTASVKIKDDDIEKTVTIPSLDTFIDKISDQLADGKIELSQVEESKFLNILEALYIANQYHVTNNFINGIYILYMGNVYESKFTRWKQNNVFWKIKS